MGKDTGSSSLDMRGTEFTGVGVAVIIHSVILGELNRDLQLFTKACWG